MFIHNFNFSILVYISATISLWNYVPQFEKTVCPVVLLANVGKLLLKLSITDLNVNCIFVWYLRDKVFIFCLCGLLGGNSLLILTHLTYNSNSVIQGDCQSLLKISITGFYAYFIYTESLHYKVLIFCLCWLFGVNSWLVLTTLTYNFNSAIQGGCNCYLNFILLVCMCIAFMLNLCITRSWYSFVRGNVRK